MVDRGEERLRIAAARADFLEYGSAGSAGVPDVVAASWKRSQSAGVDAGVYRVDYHEDVDLDSKLARYALPVIDRLTADMAEVPVTIALSDAKARIVHRRDCSNAVGRLLDRVDFHPGFGFEEDGVGTNGIGTVFEAGAPVSVVGPAHFNETLVPFACTGAPIHDPITGRIEGVLDVSLLSETWTPLIHALVKSAAADIGRNLLLDRSQAQRALFEMYLKADARPRQAVMAVGASVMVNQRAQALFTPEEQFTIHQHARYLMSQRAGRDRAVDSIELDSGRSIRMRASRILCGQDVAGVLLLLDEERPDPPRHSLGTFADRGEPATALGAGPTCPVRTGHTGNPRPPVGSGYSPAWTKACSDTADALQLQANVLVVGEPGTGKSTLLVEQFHRVHPSGRTISIDAERLTEESTIGVEAIAATDALVILRNIEKLTSASAVLIQHLIDAVASANVSCTVAATLSESSPGSSQPIHSVLANFDHTVRVPPIRFRAADIPQILTRIIHEIAPDRRTRISPAAARLINAYSWPGNITQLREALRSALHRRPVGEIQVEDLPGFCRTTSPRTLTALETAERDTILHALHEHAGNRVHAAAALGMSRSSLYRKLKTYAITEV